MRGAWYRRRPRPPYGPLHQIVFTYARGHRDARFVQIGAHDGTQLDPLRWAVLATGWRGIMVEPVPYVFDRLRARYGGNPRLYLENLAIHETAESLPFYFIPESDGNLWEWYDALGSFRREVLVSHTGFIADVDEIVESMPVACITFDDLCARHGFAQVDLIQIDTEGMDLTILRTIDLARYRPALVMVEELHMTQPERAEARTLLTNAGYRWVADGMDLLGLRTDVLDGSVALQAACQVAVDTHTAANQ